MVHHVAVQDVLPGEIEEARAEGDAPAVRHDGGVEPERRLQRLAVDPRELERVDVDVEDVVVVLVQVRDLPLLDRAQLDLLIDALRIEEAAIDEEGELPPVPGGVDLRRVP